jgi:hypothetical protein
MMTEEQVWREFQAECPEMVEAVKYQTGRLPGQDPTPIIPLKTASALVNWAPAKGYASAQNAERMRQILLKREAEASHDQEPSFFLLNTLTLLLR